MNKFDEFVIASKDFVAFIQSSLISRRVLHLETIIKRMWGGFVWRTGLAYFGLKNAFAQKSGVVESLFIS